MPWPALGRQTCDCEALPDGIDWLRCLGPYDGTLRAVLQALKYDGRQTLATPLGQAMRARLQDAPAGTRPRVVPVPLHAAKGFRRGFNQADRLAVALAGPWPVDRALIRVHGSPTQTRFDRQSRQANVTRAFALRSARRWFTPPTMKDAHIILVDDVVTTGATLSACARVLRAAGAARVGAAVVARTEPRPVLSG